MIKLKRYFNMFGFEDNDLDRILNSFRLQTFKKNEFFVKQERIGNHLGFVESGVFQYYVLKEGEIRTTYVSIENTFMASRFSFVNDSPAIENVKALTDGSICIISKANLKKLINEIPSFKDFYIGFLESSICSIDANRHDLILLSGEQRYNKMLKEEPELLQKIPLQCLASILGVTPRHLSRIRNNIR
ncbi:Crp/Fnr family transcriptional regulator [Flavobacterium sp. GT3P67]|uniref:Crp/Fnr family transcriptional regulator n=1 Tax=Flavobacterium sp. GT3P67 TaxID=2541722 RepID=UPI0010507D6C|nr:Crp/Fnr family transcriptional regulator [Flavobacterium sp. GT3P67]TDE47955.1 Crp/Fnr family transcriptional regulator [Flavobacterium sp. GT3P67]